MKCSESWLREWVNPKLTREQVANLLTMAGLEVEACEPVSAAFTNVVVGRVLSVEKHSGADKLSVCKVDVGHKTPLSIVCGAPNVKIGMKVPVALIDAVLPDIKITRSNIRGVESEGMLCSATELGLAEASEGLLALPENAVIGEDVRQLLQLEDYTIDVSVTPNRSDCLSVRGIAREISALTKTKLQTLAIPKIRPILRDTLKVTVKTKKGCPRYAGRILRNVQADASTPLWLQERLRRSGVRSISAIVDVTNYVMLELGQPMHAFDLQTIKTDIIVRNSRAGEQITLLDGSEQTLDDQTMVIADQEKPLAIAGVMGGLNSSVTLLTTDIFLESAYFSPDVIAAQRQYYNLSSESAYRFERGVDPTIQQQALERATELIIAIAGGAPGLMTEVVNREQLPKLPTVKITKDKVTQVLGFEIANDNITDIFDRLHFQYKKTRLSTPKAQWEVKPPPYRFDIHLPEDLIEEIVRVYGYEKIPDKTLEASLQLQRCHKNELDPYRTRQVLCDEGYFEIVSYSFVKPELQHLLNPNVSQQALTNPISSDMAVMRNNLWPGLIDALLYNKSRQQHRVRLFEIGTCFIPQDNQVIELQKLAGLASGQVLPEQWGLQAKEVDFFDIKGDIQNLLKLSYQVEELVFQPDHHPALHPGQAAGIYHQDQKIGILGMLHPSVLQTLDINEKVYVFELDLNLLKKRSTKAFEEVSKFPEIRRDIAILVNEAIPSKAIQDTIKTVAGDWLKEVFIFDVYQGTGVKPGFKSIALALILQHPTRTLIDDEVAALMGQVIAALKGQLGAELRS